MERAMAETLVRAGPGTLMGNLMRRYWVPILLASEIPGPDCPQVRVKILGERLIEFRDSKDRAGLIDEFCAHRGTSLFFGRNEECCIRCAYHGWKFDLTGQCVDLPSAPQIAPKMRIKAYACIERGGVEMDCQVVTNKGGQNGSNLILREPPLDIVLGMRAVKPREKTCVLHVPRESRIARG